MTPAEWRAAHAAGWSAYRKWQAETWPERECVAAAVSAALMSAGLAVDVDSERRSDGDAS